MNKEKMSGFAFALPDLRTEKKLPNTWNISFEGFDSIAVMEALGRDIAVSPGAACHGSTVNASHVLVAMGTDPALARGAIRFSV